ncbi:MAG: hypothetical protein JW864_03530 [Spirochaetes bacterium]|nr:hypothetical protein [Spirochaetota bacterium]
MKKIITFFVFIVLIVSGSNVTGLTEDGTLMINKMRLMQEDIPEGYMYGQIPDFAKKVLKHNPWNMDKDAIKTLTEKIYPGGDYNQVTSIHVTIIAKKETPHGDDIVCYIIKYRDAKSAKEEISKISEYVGYNGDRAILSVMDNMAVFLHVDDKEDFHIIRKMEKTMKERFKRG